jgi:thioredoxin-dependent peroxiredoxin
LESRRHENALTIACLSNQGLFGRSGFCAEHCIIHRQNKRFLPERNTMSKLFTLIAVAVICASAVFAFAPVEPPAVGTKAPEFKLTTNEGTQASLNDYQGKWVVLYFYPKDFTSGCTLQAHNFQTDLPKYEAANAVILGVSVDSAESHKSFCAKERLTFKLLSDADTKVSESYGSLMEYNGMKLSARNTFIVDPKGKIARVFLKVKPAGHSTEVLAALAELQKK